ncbi:MULTISPECIES: ABC transporter permease [Halomonas]|uniref:ABC transporter permease n=2 Tax=Halomonas TaxID=2745 RepID=A0ABQ0U427_9GAMM|nr:MULTISPECIES: ABC transporter permease subunit [Halomonas]PSJ21109.1 ABC transporter permease [Halomonas sp. ND22Bw]KGE77285.1 ABC transporter permease [Halomonas salina]MDR5890752.1 ABC transporter permease subunit [Halomonas salina]RAH38110.1 ABC transporter permease subunit [Halomonas sp. SL1]WJY05984.1 ABC transporter permease subunit [Halomonas halophila]
MNHVSQEGLLDWAGPILQGALTTLEIAVLAYAIGLVLGLIGASARLSPWAPLRGLATAYSTAVRAVPELLLIILLYYAGSQALTALTNAMGLPGQVAINGFVTAVGVLAFVQGAYMTEVMRGAIQAIPRGQLEAADAFGFSAWDRFHRIVVPAMLPHALPGMSNLWLILIKDTALISVIGFSELFFTIQQAAASTRAHFLFYAAAGVIYLAMTLSSTALFTRLEQRVRRGQPTGEEA